MDTLSLTPQWTATASARYNDARVSIRDRSGSNPDLDGDHDFRRINPSLGLTFNPSTALTAYGSYSEGMRAPTAIELTCADPQAPCKLPNSFLADPPLKKVVARTMEIGARGREAQAHWSAALYRTDLSDDIQFVSSGGAINTGYFQNVGKTRRQGVELSAGTSWGPVAIVARYSAIAATYRTPFEEHSPANSSANAAGDIAVRAGDRIPSIPAQTLRVRLDVERGDKLSLAPTCWRAAPVICAATRTTRTRTAGARLRLLNLDGRWRLARNVEVFARINNVFDRQYSNFGVLGYNAFANADAHLRPGEFARRAVPRRRNAPRRMAGRALRVAVSRRLPPARSPVGARSRPADVVSAEPAWPPSR
jgi:outer membrane receptor protein involved in Fe transport